MRKARVDACRNLVSLWESLPEEKLWVRRVTVVFEVQANIIYDVVTLSRRIMPRRPLQLPCCVSDQERQHEPPLPSPP